MNLTIPLSHDHALHAIGLVVADVDPTLRRVVAAVMTVHIAQPSPTGRPEPDCYACEGKGWFEREATGCDGMLARTEIVREHCHCRCPYCVGCSEPVCDGPCETIAAIGAALGIEGLTSETAEKQEGPM